jgi:hypothetical protein
MVGLCDFPPAVFPFFGYRLAVVPVAAFVALAFPFTVAPVAVAIAVSVSVAAVPIASAVVAVIVAVPAAPTPAAPAAPLKSAALAQLTDLSPVMFGLATEPAVAFNVAVELPFLVADALEASVVTITRLGSGAGQHCSAQKHRRAQRGRS